MGQIADDVALAALETVLKPLGTSIKHYMPAHKAAAIEAMRGVLMAERDRAAAIIEAECERVLSKQNGKDHAVDLNLRLIAMPLPDIAERIRGEAA